MEEKTALPRRRKEESSFAQSFLIRYGLKIFLGITVIVLFLTAVQCNIEKPESPIWTTNLIIPVVNRTYQMPEIIDKIDQPGLTMDSSGEVMFSFHEEMDTISVDGDLSTDENSITVFNTIGQVTIQPGNPPPLTVNLGDYVSLTLDSVPPASFDILNDLPPLDGYNWAAVASGAVYVVITNDFGLDLDTVIVDVIDLGTYMTISTVEFPPPGILAGETDSIAIGLGGKTISNLFRLQIHCHTPGASMLTLSDKTLSSSVSFGQGLTVSSAEAEVPSISKNFAETVELFSANTVISAEISSGNVILTLDNESGLSADLDITIPDFTLNGNPLNVTRTVPPSSSDVVDINVAGYVLEPADQVLPQELDVDVFAHIDSTTPNMVIVNEEDTLRATTLVTPLSFSSLTGIIDSTEATFDNMGVDIDLPRGFDSVQLINAVLTLEIENAVEFSAGLNLNIQGDGGQLLNISGSIPAGNILNPVTAVFIDSNLSSFLDPVPSSITVNGSALFGDGSTVGTVTDDSYVVPRVSISSPLEFIIDQTTFAGDTTSENIDQSDIDLITEHVIIAEFTGTVTNHLPLGVAVSFFIDGDSTRLNADSAQLVVGPLDVASGVIGPGNVVEEAVESEVVLQLDSVAIKILENETLFAFQEITIMGTDGQPVKVLGTDYVTVSGVFEVEYRFDGDF